jgi:hypothetical protein
LTLTACRSAPDAAVEAAAPAPAVFRYAPAQASYLTVSRRSVEQDLQGMTQQTDIVLRLTIHSDITPLDSGFQVTFTVDSVLDMQLPGASSAEARRLEGRRFSAAAHPTGELIDFDAGATTSPFAQQVANTIEQFFPTVPFDGVREGAAWTDSTSTVGNSGGAQITTTAVTENHAEVWTQFLGQDALVVAWVSRYRFTGAGEQLGQPFTIDGGGERVGRHYLSRDGRLLATMSTDSSTAQAEVSGLGMTIPIRQIGADSILIQVTP